MGDHRASIKIEFEFHGHKEKADWWINWSPDTSCCQGVDQRIIDWIREQAEIGYRRYDEQMAKYWKEEHDRATEKAEREQLETLKSKYEAK